MKAKKEMFEVGKMSVSSKYSGLCCPYDTDAYRWGNKKRGGIRHVKKSLHDHRSGKDFRGKSEDPNFKFDGKKSFYKPE